MPSLSDSLVASSSRPLGLRVRRDLSARRQKYQGRSYWVVKEPVGLRYFRFQDEEYAVLQMLDGPTSLEEVKERFEEEFAPHKITYQDLQQFIGTLHRSGLVVSDAPGQGFQLKKRRDERNRKELLGKLSNILAIRFKGVDPERFLNRTYPYVRWFFSPLMVACCFCVALSALLLITIQFDVFHSRLPAFSEFFGPKNWLLLGVTLGVTKIMHEFGHAFLCKHFGGECHELGVMFLVLTPCLYVNVSDSWMLPSKWKRAAIGAGGMYVELLLASIATFVWWFSEPGMLNHLALRVMFICSVSTVIFNGNPLLRFDGYYIMSDITEIPNLRQKASRILQRVASSWCLGLENPEDPFLPQSNHGFFAMYTIAAVIYRWFVFFSIMFFLNQVFEPYGLKVIGQVIASMGIFGLVVMPIWKMGKFFSVPGRTQQVKLPRLFATLGIVAFIFALIAFLPLPYNVRCSVQMRPQDSAVVYVEVPGKLDEVLVSEGTAVEAEQPLARLKNPELEFEVLSLDGQIKALKLRLTAISDQALRAGDPSALSQKKALEASLESAQKSLSDKREELASLTLTSPREGFVIAPPSRNGARGGDDRLPSWSDTPLDEKNQGIHLMPSDPFCQVADTKKLEAILAIDQSDVDLVHPELFVKIKLDGLPGRTFEGIAQGFGTGGNEGRA